MDVAGIRVRIGNAAARRTLWRIASFAASFTLVSLACFLLVWLSRTPLRPETFVGFVELNTSSVQRKAERLSVPGAGERRRRARPAAVASAEEQTPLSTAERDALALMLRCFAADDEERTRRDCFRQERPPEWDSRARLPVVRGGPSPEREISLEALYTRAEIASGLAPTPRCFIEGFTGAGPAAACATLGRAPGPPARSAVEICEAGGIGPCRPPPWTGKETE